MKERASKVPEIPTRKFIALAGGARREPDFIKGTLGTYRLISGMMGMMTKNAINKMMTGIEIKFILMVGLADPECCVARVYQDYLGRALAEKQFVPAPAPYVVGCGVEHIDEALKLNQKGVSVKKLVVSLP